MSFPEVFIPPDELADASKDEWAEKHFGRRPTNVLPFDVPGELGYRCPTCLVRPISEDGDIDERLWWSEYEGHIWCRVCNRDYPSVLCIDVTITPDQDWKQEGVDAAITVFRRLVERALAQAGEEEE